MPDFLFEYISTDGDTPFSKNSNNHVKFLINNTDKLQDLDKIKSFMHCLKYTVPEIICALYRAATATGTVIRDLYRLYLDRIGYISLSIFLNMSIRHTCSFWLKITNNY